MAYKPERIRGHRLCRGNRGASYARKAAKKASSRQMRKAAKLDPEGAPTRRILAGYID